MKYLSTLAFVLLLIDFSYSQDCFCQDCPIVTGQTFDIESCIDISGLTNGTLGSGGQDICEVAVNFEHSWIGDFEMRLVAPDGSFVELVWNGAPGGPSTNTEWDITYVQCSDTANPDTGYDEVFPSQGWDDGLFTGSYYPGNGCLEDLTGNANGEWCLELEDNVFGDVLNLVTWSITFCDATGIDCDGDVTCDAEGGDITIAETTFCEGDPELLLDITVTGENETTDYGYTYSISDITAGSGPILYYEDMPDLTTFTPGVYNVCGVSYLLDDLALITPANGSNTTTDLIDDIDADVFCGDFNDFCINIVIEAAALVPDLDFPTTACAGETVIIDHVNYVPPSTPLVQVVSGGFSTLIPESDQTEFVATSGPVEICYINESICGDETTCAVITIDESGGDPELFYQDEACVGQLLTITFAEFPANDYDFTIPQGSVSSIDLTSGTITYTADATGTLEICLQVDGPCGMFESCAIINVEEANVPILSAPATVCVGEEFTVTTVNFDGSITYLANQTCTNCSFTTISAEETTGTAQEPQTATFCVTALTSCGDQETCIDIVVEEDPADPMISGELLTCYGGTYVYTVTNLDNVASYSWSIDAGEDSEIVGDNTMDMVTVNIPTNINYSASICLDYTSDCGVDNQVCIDITPVDDIGNPINQTDPFICGLSGTLSIDAPNVITGVWTLFSGPGGATFTDATATTTDITVTLEGTYLFTYTEEDCGGSIDVEVTFGNTDAGTMDLLLVEVCGDDLVTIVNLGDESIGPDDNLIYILHTLSGNTLGTILDENATGTFSFLPTMTYGVTYYVSAVAGNASGTSVDLTDPCLDVAEGQPLVFFEEAFVLSIMASEWISCTGIVDIEVIQTSDIPGVWVVDQSPAGANVIFDPPTGDNIQAIIDVPGDYTMEYQLINGPCFDNGFIAFSLAETPTAIVTDISCDADNLNYTVTLEISGGTQPYFIDGFDIGGTTFTSAPIPSGSTYSFSVTDDNGCEADLIEGIFNCDCATNAGTMDTELLEFCSDEIINVTNNDDETLDSDDNLIYVLHTSATSILGDVLAESISGNFVFLPTMTYGVTYYISAVAGDGSGIAVDYTDECLSVAAGQPIIFYEFVNVDSIIIDPYNVCMSEFSLEAITNTSISGFWSATEVPIGTSLAFTTLMGDVTFANVSDPGIYEVEYTITNGPCVSSDTVTLEFIGGPSLSPTYECDAENENYQVTFTITGGQAPFTYNGVEVSGDTFTSDPIPSTVSDTFQITDANGCFSELFIANFECDVECLSESGTMPLDTLIVCETDTVCVSNLGDAVFESDDVGYYVIHTQPDTILGTVQGVSADGKLTISPSISFGVLYYVSYVVGDSLIDGTLDFDDQCLSVSPGQPISFLQQAVIDVGPDLEACEFTTPLQAIINNGTIISTWQVITQPEDSEVDFSEIFSTITEVTVDRSGEYLLSYSTQLNDDVCFGGDTLLLTVYDTLSAIIVDYQCDFDTDTYVATLQITGGDGNYSVDGSGIADSTYITPPIVAGTTVDYTISNGGLCDSITVSVFNDCNCPSDPGTMSNVPLTECPEYAITVDPAVGSTVAFGDSVVYVLHQGSEGEIINFIAVSADGTFSFDPNIMSPLETYYVSAVVYSGGVFVVDFLTDECTLVSVGTPVTWSTEYTVSAFEDVVVCRGEPVIIGLTYEGEVPATLTISTGTDNEELEITQEGFSEYTIDIQFSTVVTPIDLVTNSVCSFSLAGTWAILIEEPPSLELEENIEICNSTAEGSLVTLDDLIINSTLEGEWTDIDGNEVTDIIDFDSSELGQVAFIFTTINNPNSCPEVSDTTVVTVVDCTCPTVDFLTFDSLCQGNYSFVLDDYIDPLFIDQGTWSIDDVNGTPLTLADAKTLEITDAIVGSYNIIYTLNEVPDGCDESFSFSVTIYEQLEAGNPIIDMIDICLGDLDEILLFDYIENYDEGGQWVSTGALGVDGTTDEVILTDADVGLFVFDYIIPANGLCEEQKVTLTLVISEPLALFLELLDPLCFGEADGSISVSDVEGNLISDYILTFEDGTLANPDSLGSGDYELSYTTDDGCLTIEYFTLVDPLELFLDLGDDIEVPEGQLTTVTPVLNLTPQEVSLYQWFINQSTAESTFDTLLLSPDGETLVELIITDDNGCITSDDLLISVIEDNVDVVLPNIFNTQTSSFGVEAFEDIELINDFSIYNRWGEQIFSATNYDPRSNNAVWDGTFKGSKVGPGVFVYKLEYTDTSGEIVLLYGDVTTL